MKTSVIADETSIFKEILITINYSYNHKWEIHWENTNWLLDK